MINQFYIDYIKAIENPDRVGWNGKVWTAPQYKGYDKNQRGYGIDIVKNDSAKRLTQNRPGQWLTEGEADKLMKEHLLYVYGAALKHIEGFDNLSDKRKAALLGMLYRGDSVNKNKHIININEPDDNKFFESISNYYKSKGLNERARNSSNFFNNQTNFLIPMKWEQWEPPMKFKSGGQVRKMQTAAGGPIYWLRKRLYNNIEPFGYNDVGSRLINAIVLNKNEHNNFKGDYSDIEKAPALYLTIDNIWGEYLHIPEKERRYSNGKYKIKNNGNGTFSLPFKSMDDIMQAVNSSNNPLLWGLRGKLGNSVVGEYDVHRGYDKNGDYLKYIDHWRINPYDVKENKEYGLDDNSLLRWYFKGKDDASFGLGTPVEIQGKYYLDDIYNVKGKDRGGHYLPEIIVTGKKKQGGKMNIIKLFKEGGQIRKMLTASGGPIINGGTPFSITVKGKDRRPAWKRMYLNPNLGDTSKYYNGNILEGVIGLTPGIGDAIDAVKAADAINNKDYTTAGFLGAGLLLPNIIEKPLKFARGLYKGYKANKMMKAARKAYDESGEKLEVDAFKSGSKPMYVTPAKGPGSNHIDVISDELKDSKYLDLERPFGKDRTLTLRYYINEGKLKQTIGTYKDLYKDRLGLYTNDVDKIYNHIISNPKLLDLNVNPGTTGLLDIIGVSLGYGPKDAILFKIGYNGLNTGEKVSKDAIESMKTYGYDRTLPGIYNILKKNIERGTLGVKSTNTNGGHVGFGYIKNKLGGMLQLLKNGSGIHIKEKNKGKFTSYCGGKVTDECILKGKNSSNPAIRKRATFAANARKWKHKEGGVLKAQFGIPLNLSSEDIQGGFNFIKQGLGKVWDIVNTPITGSSGVSVQLPNGNLLNIQGTLGGAPEILPGKMDKGVLLIEKHAPNFFRLINEFPTLAKNLVLGNVKLFKEFFRTGNKDLLKLFETKSDFMLNTSNSKSTITPKGFTKGNEVTPTSGTQPISETGLNIRETRLGNMNNPPKNPSEKLAVEDWNTMNPNNKINPLLPTGRPSYKLELDGLNIDIRYPKLTTPTAKKIKIDYTQSGTSLERAIEGKRYGIPRKGRVSSNDRNARAMESGDARTTNAGYTNVKKGQIKLVENNLDKYPKFEIENHNKLLLRLYRKNRSEAEINKVKREFYKYLAKKYGYFKIGGIIKASDGTKTSWISNSLGKVGNFLNSDWGKLAFNGISSIFGGNSEPSYNVLNNYSDTMTDTAMQYILQLLQQALALSDLDSTLKSLYDPLNPHSIDGDIVKRHYKWLALAPQLALLKELQKQLKELIDAQNKLQKTNYITNALTNTLLTGFDLALNYKPTTKKGSSVS